MKKREYKAYGIGAESNIDKVVSKLTQAGIENTMYRINHFQTNAEIVAEPKIIKKIKSVIG